MPAPVQSRTEVLDRLLLSFRRDGYDGASLSTLSEATGLGRSSLYHYFPGGKADMAEQVLRHLSTKLEGALLAPLHAASPPAERLDGMLDTLATFYDQGRQACLLERLSASVDRPRFQSPLAAVFQAWLNALVTLLVDAGFAEAQARGRAEDTVGRVEGALVLAAGLDDPGVFCRALARIRAELLVGDRGCGGLAGAPGGKDEGWEQPASQA